MTVIAQAAGSRTDHLAAMVLISGEVEMATIADAPPNPEIEKIQVLFSHHPPLWSPQLVATDHCWSGLPRFRLMVLFDEAQFVKYSSLLHAVYCGSLS